MKKLFVLLVAAACFSSVNVQAQGGDPAAREARMKEMKTGLVDKAKITKAQADKVMEIYNGAREQRMGLRDLNEADRAKKMEEINADLAKKYKAIPLTDDQVKAVTEYMASMRRGPGGARPGGN